MSPLSATSGTAPHIGAQPRPSSSPSVGRNAWQALLAAAISWQRRPTPVLEAMNAEWMVGFLVVGGGLCRRGGASRDLSCSDRGSTDGTMRLALLGRSPGPAGNSER